MKIRSELVVLSVSKYEVVDQTTGVINQGTTVRYLLSDNINPVAEENLKGFKLAKCSFPGDIKMFDQLETAPAVYAADMVFGVKSDGTPSVKLSNFEFKRLLTGSLIQDAKAAQGAK